jgi:hypothetical protein
MKEPPSQTAVEFILCAECEIEMYLQPSVRLQSQMLKHTCAGLIPVTACAAIAAPFISFPLSNDVVTAPQKGGFTERSCRYVVPPIEQAVRLASANAP